MSTTETIFAGTGAVATAIAAGFAAFSAWRSEQVTRAAAQDRRRERWLRARAAGRLVSMELTGSSLPVERLVGGREWIPMNVSRTAWNEHRTALAELLKKADDLYDIEHAYRTLEQVQAKVSEDGVDFLRERMPGVGPTFEGRPTRAEFALQDVHAAQGHPLRVDAGFDTFLEISAMKERARRQPWTWDDLRLTLGGERRTGQLPSSPSGESEPPGAAP